MDSLKVPKSARKNSPKYKPIRIGRVELTDGDGEGRIEHVLATEKEREGIRFSWWVKNMYMRNALELPESDLLKMFQDAINNGVFSSVFREKLSVMLRHP
jgi:hypothetical protein